MARTALTKTTIPSPYAGAGVAATMTAADTSNKNSFPLTGREIVIAYNSGASSHTVTVTSVDDRYGRSEDISAEAIAAGAIRVYGVGLALEGWQQTDGSLYLEANHAEVKFGVLVLPS